MLSYNDKDDKKLIATSQLSLILKDRDTNEIIYNLNDIATCWHK